MSAGAIITDQRKSISKTLSYAALILLSVTLGATCYLVFGMDTKLQEANKLCQITATAQNRLWKISGYSTRYMPKNIDSEKEKIVYEISAERTSFLKDLHQLTSKIPKSLVATHEQLDNISSTWSRIEKYLDKINDDSYTVSQREQMLFERDMNSILISLSLISDTLSDRTDKISTQSSAMTAVVYIFILCLIMWVIALTRSVSNRIKYLQDAAVQIASGDLTSRAPILGNDEMTTLAESFNSMAQQIEQQIQLEKKARSKMEKLLSTLRATAETISEASNGILSATTKQTIAMSEESAAVSETSVTVEELKQVTILSTQKAEEVANLALASEEVSKRGNTAVQKTIDGMMNIRREVQSMATDMQHIAEQTQAVGEIISAVQELAERSNMLAVNAAIEAARAGEHGYGFSVVANEVHSLADQSRQATVQVRSILGDIKKAVTTALNNTASGTQATERGVELVNEAGDAINSLSLSITKSSNSAKQIYSSTEQQYAGVDQISQAMAAIQAASKQTLENTRQSEEQAKNMKQMLFSLRNLLQEDTTDAQD